jgi:hypothetical protein
MMHFLFNLLKIKGFNMFRIITCSSSGGAAPTALGILRACYVSWLHLVQSNDIIRTQYTRAVCAAPSEDEQVMIRNR